jgi:hypothetical protein
VKREVGEGILPQYQVLVIAEVDLTLPLSDPEPMWFALREATTTVTGLTVKEGDQTLCHGLCWVGPATYRASAKSALSSFVTG